MERIMKKALFKLPKGGVFLYGNYARELMINEGLILICFTRFSKQSSKERIAC